MVCFFLNASDYLQVIFMDLVIGNDAALTLSKLSCMIICDKWKHLTGSHELPDITCPMLLSCVQLWYRRASHRREWPETRVWLYQDMELVIKQFKTLSWIGPFLVIISKWREIDPSTHMRLVQGKKVQHWIVS